MNRARLTVKTELVPIVRVNIDLGLTLTLTPSGIVRWGAAHTTRGLTRYLHDT